MKTELNILTLIFTLFAIPAFAQNWDAIKESNIYLCGEGWGMTVAEADRNALNDLISKISVQVSGHISQTESETTTNAGIEANSTFSSVINTYSNATLTNTEKIIIKNEPDAHVGRWIRRSDVAKIFESRKNKISDYISSALKAESQGKIDIALKDLYWALTLTKTLQDPNDYKYVNEDGESFLAVTWIPHYINDIFDNIQTDVLKRTGDDLELRITYKGKPVNSIDYTYFDGRDWSNIYSAKDGVGVLELAPGCQNSYYQLKFEYEYRGEAHIDSEVESVLASINSIPMRNAYKSVKSETSAHAVKQNLVESPITDSFASIPAAIYEMPTPISDNSRYLNTLNALAKSIVSRRYDELDGVFTPDAKDIYERLIKYGRAKIVGTPEYSFYSYGDNVIARGLQMSFSFSTGMRKSFVEEVIFSFDSAGKINNISFGLGKTAEADILGKSVWDENARFAIMNFLENYQTAYALKRLDYISSIFDDDAVIITGTVTHAPARKVRMGDMQGIEFGQDIIKYNRHTKDTYLRDTQKIVN